MPNNQSKTLAKLDLLSNDSFNVLNIKVVYDKQPACLNSQKPKSRGLYLVITPAFEQREGDFTTTKLVRFSGFKMLIEPLARFSKKRLEECYPDPTLLHFGLSDVAMKNKLSLATKTLSHDEKILQVTNKFSKEDRAA